MTAPLTFSLAETAELLGIGLRTAYDIVERGDELAPGIRAFKVGSQWKTSRRAFELLGLLEPTIEAVA